MTPTYEQAATLLRALQDRHVEQASVPPIHRRQHKMTPERLEFFHQYYRGFESTHVGELLAYVDELTRQLDDARDKAINAGIFTSTDGDQSRYSHALNTDTCENCGKSFGLDVDYCGACDLEASTPGATSYKP